MDCKCDCNGGAIPIHWTSSNGSGGCIITHFFQNVSHDTLVVFFVQKSYL